MKGKLLLLLAALTLTGTLAMGKTKERFVLQSKNYEFQDLKSSCAVEVEHSFGTIKFIDCEPGQVRVEVKVTTTETDETFIKDMRFMNPIEEVEVNKSGNKIIIENKNQRNENGFNRSRKGKRGYSGSRRKSEKDWSVDITVYMPAEMSINLEAAFCDITMSENNQGERDLEVAFCDMTGGDFNLLYMESAFSNAVLGDIKEADIDASFSDIKAETIGSISGDFAFGSFHFNNIKEKKSVSSVFTKGI